MQLEMFNEISMPIVIAACLLVGFILKKWLRDLDNKWIPTILAVLGAVLGCVVCGKITLECIVGGAFSGLASTGMHQAFKQILEKNQTE